MGGKLIDYSSGVYFDIVGHRDSGLLYGKHGEQIRGSLLDFHGMLGAKLGIFQLVQVNPRKVIIKVQKQKLLKENILQIKETLGNKFGIIFDFTFQEVDEIELTKRGKYKMLIQKIDRGGVIRKFKLTLVLLDNAPEYNCRLSSAHLDWEVAA